MTSARIGEDISDSLAAHLEALAQLPAEEHAAYLDRLHLKLTELQQMKGILAEWAAMLDAALVRALAHRSASSWPAHAVSERETMADVGGLIARGWVERWNEDWSLGRVRAGDLMTIHWEEEQATWCCDEMKEAVLARAPGAMRYIYFGEVDAGHDTTPYVTIACSAWDSYFECPIRYCPFCGRSITVALTEADRVTPYEPPA